MVKVFVVGCPRSGTTLIQSILAGHRDTFTLKETHFLHRVRRQGISKMLDFLFISQARVETAYSFIRENNRLLNQYDPSGVRTLPSAVRFLDTLMSKEAEVRGKRAWVEKTPRHLYYITWIQPEIPQARFVHVLRDGRDVVASLVHAAQRYPEARAWKRFADFEEAVRVYNRALRESIKYADQVGHIFLRYEDLLDDFEATRNSLYRRLQLEEACESPDLDRVHSRIVRPDELWKEDKHGEVVDTRLKKFMRIFEADERQWVSQNLNAIPPEIFSP